MQPKEYQQKAVDRFYLYLDELDKAKSNYDKLAALKADDPSLDLDLPNYPTRAWQSMRAMGEVGRSSDYSPRIDEIGRPVPNVTLKVPTGGGKTYLAAAFSATLVTRYVKGGDPRFVLWIVPNEAIYAQTKKCLTNRDHPYRQILDVAAQGRVKILEKDSPLHADDVAANLCVMLLMLPSAARTITEKLKVFKDRGSVNGFFPPDDDQPAHAELRKQIPNLDYVDAFGFGEESQQSDIVGLVKSSLGNALRMIRPIVVMDEGQKAFSEIGYKTLYDFNPRFVIELSATPKDGHSRWANWLCNISGEELLREEMIKMPMEVQVSGASDWRDCLREAWVKTEMLRQEADINRADSQVYIRPILLVQVERVGKDQRESQMIHSEDAKEYLISLGLPEEAIAIKTAEQNDLKNPENQNLLERGNPVRVIITKQALQEGWDCPFAYVLCALAVSRSVSALTQLVGRVLRQPYAAKTGRESLDRCYIFTHRAETGEVVKAIKSGLEKDGMGDLASMVVIPSARVSDTIKRYRRHPLKDRTFYLPEVKFADTPDSLRNLDWETDILARIDWLSMPFEEDGREFPKSELMDETQTVVVGLDVLKKPFQGAGVAITLNPDTFDRQFAVRAISGTVDNPWVAATVVERFVSGLRLAGWTEKEMAARQSRLRDKLSDAVGKRLEAAARTIFDQGLKDQRIRFHLTTSAEDWKLPVEEKFVQTGQMSMPLRNDGQPFQHSLFDPVLDGEMNGFEFDVACFLDRQSAVWWWYRNVVRGRAYGLQGWRKNRVYPDFVIAHQMIGNRERWFVMETKGNQLSENLDTKYKGELMDCLTDAYAVQSETVLGELLIREQSAEYRCKLVAQDGWESTLTREFVSRSSAGAGGSA